MKNWTEMVKWGDLRYHLHRWGGAGATVALLRGGKDASAFSAYELPGSQTLQYLHPPHPLRLPLVTRRGISS